RLLCTPLSRVVLFCGFFLNPYALDFFSLCRGYGLSLAFQMHAFYFCCLYLSSENNRNALIFWAFSSLFLASLSLLTFLILIPVCTLALWVILWMKNKKVYKDGFIILIPVLTFLGGLFLTWIPVNALSKNHEFEWGTPTLSESLESLIGACRMGMDYLGASTSGILLYALYLFLLLVFIKCIGQIVRKKYSPLLFFFIIFIGLIAGLLLANSLGGVKFPSTRKALIYLPILVLCLVYFLVDLNLKIRTSTFF